MIKKYLFKSFISAAVTVSCALFMPFTSQARINIPDYLYAHYELSPNCVKTTFERDGWDLEFVSGNELNSLYGHGSFADLGYEIAGVTVYDIKTIYLSDNYGYAETSLNHEMGHYLDYSYYTYFGIQPSKTDTFYYIYSQEAQESYLYEDYELSDITEYFAQSYWSYVEDKVDLGTFYPMTYEYIDEIVADYEKAVNDGDEPIFDDKVFMMVGHPAEPTTPNIPKKGLTFSDDIRKISTTGIPRLKELIEKIP